MLDRYTHIHREKGGSKREREREREKKEMEQRDNDIKEIKATT